MRDHGKPALYPLRMTALITILLLTSLTGALGLSWVEIDAGLMVLINTEQDSAPSPFLNTLGAAIPIPVISEQSPLYWEASLLLFSLYYQYDPLDDGSPRFTPAELERADTLWTLGLILDTRFGYTFTLSDTVELGGGAGLAAVFRLPLIAIEEGGQHRGKAFSYFLIRSVYPELEITCRWRISDPLGLTFALRSYFPLFHLWDGENTSFFDQTIIMATIGFRIFL